MGLGDRSQISWALRSKTASWRKVSKIVNRPVYEVPKEDSVALALPNRAAIPIASAAVFQ